MTIETWWMFVMMTFLVSATPGPNMLLVMRCGARYGFRAATGAMTGCMVALLIMMGISAAGLGAVLQAFPSVFDVLRWAGAAYLIWLGIQCWRAPVNDATGDGGTTADMAPSRAALIRQGAMVAFSNPKAILFATAFLPQFIDPARPQLPQFAIQLATFAVIEAGWYCIYAGSGQRLANLLRKASVMKAFNRATGGAFIGFGGMMAA